MVDMTCREPSGMRKLHWHPWLVIGALSISCGGRSAYIASDGPNGASGMGVTSGTGATGGGVIPSGGSSAQAGGGSSAQASGGATSGGGDGGCQVGPTIISEIDGGDEVCDASLLWRDLALAGGFLACEGVSPDIDQGELSPRLGDVILDDDGSVIDITGFDSTRKQAWADQFSSQRWPCLAGQTFGYKCSSQG
jgi:hypothetical protein